MNKDPGPTHKSQESEEISNWRKTSQYLAPVLHEPTPAGQYDIYPAFPIGDGKILASFDRLAEEITGHHQVTIDGYGGFFWDYFRARLEESLIGLGGRTKWIPMDQARKPVEEIEDLVAPFLGGDDPLYGTRYTGDLIDFFDAKRLNSLPPFPEVELSIVYGCGASLAEWDGLLVYVELPKSEIQYRARAGSISNLGAQPDSSPKRMYKRFFYVDWVVFNQHKSNLLPKLDIIVDGQRPDTPVFATGQNFREALSLMGHNYFRARPWFEPGPWGGKWISSHIPQLSPDVPNYAWSFEFIMPENGVLLESDGLMLEVSFDFMMFHDNHAVLGECADWFGYEFPVRFAFLDTVYGGNLSVQCHPHYEYIKQFGETFTQNESYYILDCVPGARVRLGFQEDIDPDTFRDQLEYSFKNTSPVDIERFVQSFPAKKGDLFLIPTGTIHGSGVGNLVLEISQTPYIYTFKMYDWIRLDLDGLPRPINIERAFDNLEFTRRGESLQAELLSKPYLLSKGDGWRIYHLPTHTEHFYDIHRIEIDTSVQIETNGSFHMMNLVEGKTVILETEQKMRQRFNHAETFAVPAAAGRYLLINPNPAPIQVVSAFMKPGRVGIQ